MSNSMTQGNPLKVMLQFAFPLLIGNLLQQTYNIIDAAIVGQSLGAQALASVGASTSVQFLVLGFCMGSCTGFGIPVAKYFGAGDLKHMKKYHLQRCSSYRSHCSDHHRTLHPPLSVDPSGFIGAK